MTNRAAPVCQLIACSFAYAGVAALSGINLSFQAGRMYGLIGPNGGGKTTLINLLTGNTPPDVGQLLIHGRDARIYKKMELARLLALTPQHFAIDFAFSVEDVVMMGRHPHIARFANPSARDRQVVNEALARLDVGPLRARFLTHLSGGERQRVMVARALAQETGILLMDEATANLDIRHALDIMAVLREKVDEGGLVIAAIHDLDMAAAFCDELVVLRQGRVYAHGAVAATMNKAMLAEVFQVAARVDEEAGRRRVRYDFCGGEQRAATAAGEKSI
ncbi:MAG: ABC transporter ATP-binding protein [Desulfobulbaceae bacterium]|nr:ABC transporter ATP-binding protein [Desulfobulbaceae bacterium]